MEEKSKKRPEFENKPRKDVGGCLAMFHSGIRLMVHRITVLSAYWFNFLPVPFYFIELHRKICLSMVQSAYGSIIIGQNRQYLHFDGHVLVGPCQLLVPLLEGGVAFDALLQLRLHLLRPFDVLSEIRGIWLKIFSCTAVDQIRWARGFILLYRTKNTQQRRS